MRTPLFLSAILSLCLLVQGCSEPDVIKTKIPPRPKGVTDVIGLRCEALDSVRVGIIGLGMRGSGAVSRLTQVPGAVITALCDVEEDRLQKAQERLIAKGGAKAEGFYGDEDAWKKVCESPSVDLVYICTDWVHHAPIALYAMEHGKHVAIEVPAACSLDEIWALIDTAEKTRRHCMMLENCCYDFFELSTLEMARQGVFGDVIHTEGAYLHNLDPYWRSYWRSWRLEYNRTHGGDVYATHGLGPISQVLGIHRGDRMATLVSMGTGAAQGPKHVKAMGGDADAGFANPDLSCTLISTEKGRTILLEHDVMTPRPYSRMYQIVGTDGYAGKYPVRQYCLRKGVEPGQSVDYENLEGEIIYSSEKADSLMALYPSPILTEDLVSTAKKVGGHGGMDFIMDYRLIYCLRNGLPLDMDVYDLAEWSCIGPLTALSQAKGGARVEIPDFTRGAWTKLDGFSYAFAE